MKIFEALFKLIIEDYWIENVDFAFYSRSAFVIARFYQLGCCIFAQKSVVAPCGAAKRIEPSSSSFNWLLCATYAFSFAYKRARLDIESISFFSGVVLCRSFQFFPLFKNCPKQFYPRAACPKRCCRNFWKILTFSNLTKKKQSCLCFASCSTRALRWTVELLKVNGSSTWQRRRLIIFSKR